jgi:hypothetical protein
MKIPLVTGKIADTNKMNDRDAAIHEALNNLYTTCEKFNVAAMARLSLIEGQGLGFLYLPNKTDEIRNTEYANLVSSLADWITKTSGGRLIIVDTQEEDSGPQEENNEEEGE